MVWFPKTTHLEWAKWNWLLWQRIVAAITGYRGDYLDPITRSYTAGVLWDHIRASSSHIGRMMAFSEHRRGIISVFDRRSIKNRLYWHNQQVGYLCFIPFVWEQRGVIAAVDDQTAMISHLLPMCWATWEWLWGHVGAVWEPRIDRVKLAFAL